MRDFTASKTNRDLHLVALFEEATDVLDLELDVVVVRLRSKLDFLERDLRLPLSRFVLLLLLFLLELA